ncbi:MAG TPA: AbrB/MazE/SpoVT family DNA-binding domain-containing protein [Firmicutes bacterium]|nr:AbrB/MazE/SpoVT family DNA-binding domain-containing protein [Bacillota bacterium]
MNTPTFKPVDSLGRIVIPRELRESLDLQEGDFMEISMSEDTIVLKKSAS